MKTPGFIPALTAAAALALASCNCSDTPLPKEVEDGVEDVRGEVGNVRSLLDGLSDVKGNSPEYVRNLERLEEAGISIDNDVKQTLILSLGTNDDYISSVLRLCDAGFDIKLVLEELELEEALDQVYIDRLIALKNEGISPEVLFDIAPLIILEQDCMASLVTLVGTGTTLARVAPDETDEEAEGLSVEKCTSKKYMTNVDKLIISGVRVQHDGSSNGDHVHTLFALLTLEKGENDRYIDGLLDFQGYRFFTRIYAFIPVLDVDKTIDENYRYTLKYLAYKGLDVTPEFVAALSLEKGKSESYRNGLVKLHEAGIQVDHEIIAVLSLNKGRSSKFIDALIFLKSASPKLIEALTPEKASSKIYLQTIVDIPKYDADYLVATITLEAGEHIRFAQAVIDSESCGVSGINCGHNLEFDLEDFDRFEANLPHDLRENEEYLRHATHLFEAGLKYRPGLVKAITQEKGNDWTYMSNLHAILTAEIDLTPEMIEIISLELGNYPNFPLAIIIVRNHNDGHVPVAILRDMVDENPWDLIAREYPEENIVGFR